MEKINPQRKPRYRRVTVPVRLQLRDREIIKEVYRYRFLTSEHIRALVEGSDQNILRRLHKLYHGGYLDRPPEQIRPYKQGSDPMVYGLGNKGADLLEEELGIPKSKVDWTSKNREVKTVFLEHTLMVSHFLVCLRLSCARHAGVKLITQKQILAKRKNTVPNTNPLSWQVGMKREFAGKTFNLQVGMVPDALFGLYFPDAPEGRRNAFFFLEADRSTMPVRSANLRRSSYFKKMLGYWESHRQGLFKETFGFSHARVLTVTKSRARIESMIQANKEVDERRAGSKMFYFSPLETFGLADVGGMFERVWQNGHDGALMSLLD